MSSFNPTSKEQRRQSIFRAAHTVLMGSTVRANDMTAIKALFSKYPANFEFVVTMYGSDMVVQIISSLLENGTLGSGSRAHLEIPETRQPSMARDRQHVALEQEAAQSEAKALDEASRSDIAVCEASPSSHNPTLISRHIPQFPIDSYTLSIHASNRRRQSSERGQRRQVGVRN